MNQKIMNMVYPYSSQEPEINKENESKASHLSSNPKNECFDDAAYEAEVKIAFFRVFFGF